MFEKLEVFQMSQAMARRLLQNPLKVQRINSFNSAIPTSADKDKTMRIGGKL